MRPTYTMIFRCFVPRKRSTTFNISWIMKEPHYTIPHFFDLLEYRQMFWLKILKKRDWSKEILSYELRCYTRICSPKKSGKNICLISPISCWHVSRLWRHSLRLMYKQQSLHPSQSKVVCRNFSDFGCQSTEKSLSLTSNGPQTFLDRKGNQDTRRKTQWLWKWHFLWLRTKIDNWKICYRPTLALYLLSVRTILKNWEFCTLKTGPIVCFCSDSTHVFILSAPTHFTMFIRGLSILLFSLMNKVYFSCR